MGKMEAGRSEVCQDSQRPHDVEGQRPGQDVEENNAVLAPAKPEHQDITGQPAGETNEDENDFMEGWRLWVVTAGLWLSLFLSTLETTIVSTSLISITDALGGFMLRDWVVTAYLLTYTSFLTIIAKFSDLFGKKTMLLVSVSLFTIFSGLCGAANDIVTLIVLRAFQGIGASGVYSMVLVIAPGLVPVSKFGMYMAIVATVFVVASVLGPVLGGVINAHSSWRWVFLLNVPAGVIALAILAVFLPSSRESSALSARDVARAKLRPSLWSRLDVVGMGLLLALSVLLIFALEEAGTRYPWSSAVIVVPLVVAAVLTAGFAAWEVWIERAGCKQEAVFPPSICRMRLPAALLLTAFFTGFPFTSIIVNLPQRAQAVYGKSPLDAGISMLPLLLASPLATALSGVLTGRVRVPPFYILVVAAAIQLLGMGLSCGLPTDSTAFPRQLYAYEAVMGFGFGLGVSTLLVLARVVVPKRNLAVMMGAATQVRVLGGTISLAICAMMLNSYLAPKLRAVVDEAEASAVLESLSALGDLAGWQQAEVRRALSEGHNRQNVFMTGMTGLGFISTCFLWERDPRRAE